MSKRLLMVLLLFATAVAFAQSAYVNIESRLTTRSRTRGNLVKGAREIVVEPLSWMILSIRAVQA